MSTSTTDYLVIGAGAVGMAFADTLLTETDAHITIVDRHGRPGGHWNDAYPFVTLHQPSAFYGVSSLPLGSGRKDVLGPNAGLHELATGAEVTAYFERVMHDRFLPSGRVRYLPMSVYEDDGKIVSLLSGRVEHITPRKRRVDATYFQTSVPATHTRKYAVDESVRCIPPNALPDLWRAGAETPERFVILGAGKTAMDAGVWLINSGASPDAISWVVPRDSWLLNRERLQPGMEFFDATIGGQLAAMTAFAESASVDELFERLEQSGQMLRIDPAVKPTMFHYATMAPGEVEILRAIRDVVRLGRVLRLSPGRMELQHGARDVPRHTIFIDCTATAVARRPTVPIFQDGLITPQMARIPQPAFSAALIAKLEADERTDEARNALCHPIALPETLSEYPRATLLNLMNQMAWGQDKILRTWIRDCRLDGFGKVVAAVRPEEAEKIAVLTQFRAMSMAAAVNIQARLMA